jgi:primosomal protein N' (replication factor Y)
VKYASVVVDAVLGNKDYIFDYAVAGEDIFEGSRVLVPFGKQTVEGFVLKIKDGTDFDKAKIKEIIRPLDDFVAIKPEFLTEAEEICAAFRLRLIDVLRLFVPTQMRGNKATDKQVFVIKNPFNDAETKENINALLRSPKQAECLETFIENKTQILSEIKFGAAVINALISKGFLVKEKQKQSRKPNSIKFADKKVNLTDEQKFAIAEILKNENKKPFLLHGITGSGKTEVYMNVIAAALAEGKSAIMLVPEIGLTPQVLGNFKARFGETVAMLHSGLSMGERFDEWNRLYSGEAKVAVGARSAIFAPLENLGAIIIDEEHDGSYTSDSNPRFDTLEVAEIRARYNDCPLVLGSATPSIDSFHKSQTGAFELLTLTKRINNKELPPIEIVDMCAELRAGNGSMFSRALLSKIVKTIKDGNQAMLFLNRRGFTSSVMCKNCGWVARCENCDVSLVYHSADNQLKCHYCGARWTAVRACPNCKSSYLKFGATGTQKVVAELEAALKEQGVSAPILRMDADNTQNKNALIDILSAFGRTKPSVLVGTQMIAKGHDFPAVALVGVLDADVGLHYSDFRAAERTFALITQVAGRAGRGEISGEVILQTYMPKNYVYALSADYNYRKFFEKEINVRETTKYPPFADIVRILVSAERDDIIKNLIKEIMAKIREREKEFIYLGAMKSPLGRIKNKFRYQILMRFAAAKKSEMLDFLQTCIPTSIPKSVQVFFEINPNSLS